MTELVKVGADGDTVLDVVFVHGLDGDARKSWSGKQKDSFWPEWLAQDVPGVGVWSLGYDAASSRWLGHAMPIQDRAINLLAQLENHSIGQRPLCFVTHSMGGLVVKEMLLHAAEGRAGYIAFATATRGVVFLATPHIGSDIAAKAVVRALSAVFRKTPVVDALERNGAHLRQLNDRYRDWVAQAEVHVEHQVFYETQSTRGVQVVDPGSANPGLPGHRPIPVDANHIDICKPTDRCSLVYGQVKRFVTGLRDALARSRDDDATVRSAQAAAALSRQTRIVRSVDPLILGVHEARSPEATPGVRSTSLTPYLPRAHDRWLAEALGPTVHGGPSVLAVLTGESTVGKTRTMYEAVLALAPDWPLHAPADAEELTGLLDAGEIVAGSVLWLNEAQRHLAGPGGEAAALRLDGLLAATTGIVVVSSLWRRPYWEELIEAGKSPDVHAAARSLLRGPRTVMIPVPAQLTDAERGALPDGDDRLIRAAAAGAADGRVIQQLTGGPELVQAYHHGGLFSPPEHALLTAALDARRLGYAQPLQAALLAAAAEGYLTPWNRPADSDWCAGTLATLTTGTRPDGSRADIRRGLTALTAIRVRSGTTPGYLPADYLDHEARVSRRYELGPAELWEALLAHTDDPDQLTRLGQAAHARGLHRIAAQLWWRAAKLGGGLAGLELLDTVRTADPDALAEAVRRVLELTGLAFEPWQLSRLDQLGARDQATQLTVRLARDAPLLQPRQVAGLLRELQRYGQDAEPLLAREPARSVDLSVPGSEVAWLLHSLQQIGATTEIETLLSRAPERSVDLRHVDSAKSLAKVLTGLGASGASAVVLRRAVAEIDPEDLADYRIQYAGAFYRMLRDAGGDELLAAICSLLPDRVRRNPWYARCHLKALLEAGAHQLAAQFADSIAVEVDADTHDTIEIVELLHDAGLTAAAATLAGRLACADLRRWDLSQLVQNLHRLNRPAAETLTTRIAAAAESEPELAAGLLSVLSGQPSFGSVAASVAARVSLTDPRTVTAILAQLRKGEADDAVDLLLVRELGRQVAVDGPADALSDLIGQLAELNRRTDIDLMLRRGLVARVDLDSGRRWGPRDLLVRLAGLGAGAAVTSLADRLAENIDARRAGLASLVNELATVGAIGAATVLAGRLADQAALTNPHEVTDLLATLRTIGDVGTAATVATRCAAEVNIGWPHGLAGLVDSLRDLPADDAVLTLADRIAHDLDLDDPEIEEDTSVIDEWRESVDKLLASLDQAGAAAAVSMLWRRLVDSGDRPDLWPRFAATAEPAVAARLLRYGRELDSTPQPWTWAEIGGPE